MSMSKAEFRERLMQDLQKIKAAEEGRKHREFIGYVGGKKLPPKNSWKQYKKFRPVGQR